MKKCEHCGIKLIPTKELGYFHPISDCEEYDGYLIDADVRKKWDAKYGKPAKSYDDLVTMNKSLLYKINKLEKEVIIWQEKEQKKLINRLKNLMKKTIGMFTKRTK